jgi:hypothetical protein
MDKDNSMKLDPKLLIAAVAVSLLAACGGGGDDDDDGSSLPPPTSNSFADLEAAASAMAGNYIDLVSGDLLPGVSRTDAIALPASGSATYNGYVGGEIAGGPLDGNALIGELALTTEFNGVNSGAITGSATNFYDQTNTGYGGTLTVSGTTSPTSAINQLAADMAGTLTAGSSSYGVDVLLDGDFIGTAPDTVGGLADGDVAGGLFTGAFIAER